MCRTPNEKSRRIWAAAEAEGYGWGGVTIVSEATGTDHKTIRKGIKELKDKEYLREIMIRRKGGGRKKLKEKVADLTESLEMLPDPVTRGDPESPLRRTCESTYKLAEALRSQGYEISQRTVCDLLADMGYSLQADRKTQEGADHPDRNAQFEHINSEIRSFQEENCPAISADTKKKENIGNYENEGREYCGKGKPAEVRGHDFPDKKLGKAAPCGVCDIGRNEGWVSVGISYDTAEFAVNTVRAWWYKMGSPEYYDAEKILITADCGGSNGYRIRLWKTELRKLADETGREIHVCHFPPGTSKRNKIGHRMFSYISKNWRGRPLLTRETVVNLIADTKTEKGLTIQAMLDMNTYKKGIKIPDEDMEKLNIEKHEFHGEWNYKILPRCDT